MYRVLVYGMTKNLGGIETYLLSLRTRMRKEKILLDFMSDCAEIAEQKKLQETNTQIYNIPLKSKHIFFHCLSIYKILKYHKEYKTVYFNLLDSSGAITALIPKLMGKRIVVHSHNSGTSKIHLHKICRPFLNLLADEYLACSKSAARFMYGDKIIKKKKVLIIPNSVDVQKFDYSEEKRNQLRERWKLDNNFVICHIGRISEQKNPFGVIDIFKKVWEIDSDARLLYVGQGKLKYKLKEYVERKGLKEMVRFLGIRNDIENILQVSDVFILPSLYEGLPISAIEAQAAALPCVVSDAITDEIEITSIIERVSLNENTTIWAKKILDKKKYVRKSVINDIRKSGYDSCCETMDKKIALILRGN